MKRPALWVAVALAVVVALFVVVLATRQPATDRQVKSPLLGHTAPVVGGPTIAGATFTLPTRPGEFVLVNFFATWCVPCQQEHDELARFALAHQVAGDATVVSVVFSDDVNAVKQYFSQRGGDWPVVRDDDGALATAWGVARVPESYLVGPDGIVKVKITGGVSFNGLQALLSKAQS